MLVIASGVLNVGAVDGLQIQVHQGTNVLLRWPSLTGQVYVIVHTKSLNDPIEWTVLEPAYAAAENTNETAFIHYDQIPAAPAAGGQRLGANIQIATPRRLVWDEPIVVKPGVKSTPVPLALYPPGVDLSGHMVIWPDGTEEGWSPVLAESYAANKAVRSFGALDGLEPLEGEGGGFAEATCGFYRVLGVKVLGGITNGATLTDYFTVTARPEFGLEYLRLLVDGQNLPGQSALLPPFTNTIAFEWLDSARMSNGGPYNIQVEAVYQINSPHSEGLHHTLSQPIQVTVFNELSFPNWDDLTEDEVCGFDVVSAHPVVDWEIDVYNIYEYIDWLEGNLPDVWPIHVMTGSTTNGIIQYDWNYVDDSGFTRTNLYDDPYFVSFTYTTWASTVQSSGNGPSPMGSGGAASAMNPLKRQPRKWPPQGHWIVAWQDMFKHYYDPNNYLKSSFTAILSMANLPESDVAAAPPFWQPPLGGTNAQTFPMRRFYNTYRPELNPTNANFFQSTVNDESLFVEMLRDPRARNLFYYGHGSPEWIVSAVYAPMLKQYNIHRYRFVWLDGCETGSGSWSDVFGIPGPGIFSIDYYKERTKRPALFVGNRYSVPIGIPGQRIEGGILYDGTIPRSQSEFYIQFIFWWQTMGREYKVAYANAQNAIKSAYPTPKMSYLEGPKMGHEYWPGDDQVRVGYDNMKFNVYNKYYDIPKP